MGASRRLHHPIRQLEGHQLGRLFGRFLFRMVPSKLSSQTNARSILSGAEMARGSLPGDNRARRTAAGAAAQSWAVVGGGFLGMTLALRLAQQGQSVTLFEAAPFLGGVAAPWRLGDLVWDRHYHVILSSDAHLRALLR